MDNKQLSWQGVRLAVTSMLLGCTLLVFIELLPQLIAEPSLFGLVIMTPIVPSLFSLPFSIIGGYALAWLLQKAQWYQHQNTKVVSSGAIIGSITLLVIFITGTFLECILDAECVGDFGTILKEILPNPVFIKALFIAAICGGFTAWRLSQLAQQKTT
jgi:hypothetical protein